MSKATYYLHLLSWNISSVVAIEGIDFDLSEWTGAVRYLLGLSLVIFGLHFLLYGHVLSYKLWKRYRDEGTVIPGDVIACETLINRFEVTVMYTATVYKFKNSRQRFRLVPDSVENKRFMRKFMSVDDSPVPRGSIVRILLLQGMPRSGVLIEEVEQHIRVHSHCRTVLILLPGLALIGIFLGLISNELQQMDDSNNGWIVSGILICLVICLARMVCRKRFEVEKNKRLNSAVAMRVVNGN